MGCKQSFSNSMCLALQTLSKAHLLALVTARLRAHETPYILYNNGSLHLGYLFVAWYWKCSSDGVRNEPTKFAKVTGLSTMFHRAECMIGSGSVLSEA